MKDKFATEQETMDMMPLDQRINYGKSYCIVGKLSYTNKHYRAVMQ